MKDIDFDELDRAVNSLMATTPASEPKDTSASAESVVTISDPTTRPSIAPASVSTTPTTESVVTPVVGSQPSAESIPVAVRPPVAPAARRGGRFMDMVSTPSDTKARTTTTPPPAAPSREGLTITPRSVEPIDSAVTEPLSAQYAPSVEQPPAVVEIMPDPIDIQNSVASSQDSNQSYDEPAETVEAQLSNPPLGSIESPFLSDAKVEKRPLNSGSVEPSSIDLMSEMNENDASSYTAEPSEHDQNGADEPPAIPQIAELDSDLVAIESNEKTDLTQAVETADAASTIDTPSVPLGASSIAQQYTTQPSSGDKSHAAIYDASQYPEPVAHPAKSKSGWLWVLWVVLLLGVGAGGAILLYNLGIIP